MNVGFLCNSMCFLRYYIPIIYNLNWYKDVNSIIYIHKRDKYDEPKRHLKTLVELGEKYGFIIRGTSEISRYNHSFFMTIEGELADLANAPVYSMTYQTDFRFSYPNYKDKIKSIFLPSQFLADYYKIPTYNARFYPPTKYNIHLDIETIRKKYNIGENGNVLLIFPRLRDANLNHINNMINKIEDAGYSVIIKTRGKDKIPNVHNNMWNIFEDYSWYPHTTLELLKISSFAINFDSTAIEECLFMNVPVINFKCKTHRKRGLDFLYKERFCLDKEEQIIDDTDILWAEGFTNDFQDIRKKYFYAKHGNLIGMVDWMLKTSV